MSAQVLFNQFAYADRLKRGGFSDDQARASAEALGDALTETVATKSDLERTEFALKADLERTDALKRIWSEPIAVKTDLERTEFAVKTDLERTEFGT